MRSGAAAGHQGCFHEAAFYDSDQAFLDAVVPFLAGGLEAGEPVVAAFTRHHQALVTEALGTREGIKYIDAGLQYARPASAIDRYRRMLREYGNTCPAQVRLAGEVPHPGTGVPWEWWARYEAAVNRAFGSLPVWGLCPYDTRTLPAEVLDDVRSTHPFIADGTTHEVNPGFVNPETFLAGRRSAWRDSMEDGPPVATFRDPFPAQVRTAITRAGRETELPENDVRGLVLGASEAVSNALLHGTPPVTVRLWSSPQRMVAAVTDAGEGPDTPFAGLFPTSAEAARGGLGLWLAFQTCSFVTFGHGPDGFTIRLVAGRAEP
ncbi:sensor histidine kinase [Paractinoplanes atraurantiacus]|uniref:Anti-sigma regulatory factor (Ser/Thr protein kinase) n=1 Tax=Paractinoplanes atraurantiacus TaxID=1036182 RepID=A0A285HRP2_9ACTN|nr:sensor histidine kinase [Actinoplanes atraurantiacus]SNY38263.1 Anti-sigma regulatory factor (Ser/Thr protein kinase) [Actinoplanes atraurantiacus]